MTDQLETDLREALTRRAADVPADATARLRALDYHPRAHRLRPPVAVGALAGAAGAVAVVGSIVGLGARASNAFAGWSSSPTQAAGDQTSQAEAACRSRLSVAPAPPSPPGTTVPKPSTGTLSPVLTDTRGPFTVVILAGDNGNASCITGPSFVALTGSAGPGASDVPAGRIQLSSTHLTTRDGHPYTLVEGHAGPGVTDASLALSDGSRVKASIKNGWFAAWWPGGQDTTRADVTTPSGTTTQHLLAHGPLDCGPGPCTRRGATGSGGIVTRAVHAGGSGTGPVTGSMSSSR